MSVSFHQKLGNIEFEFEDFNPKPGFTAYYIKPISNNYKGFFMEKASDNEWKVIHRQIIPAEILSMERLLSRVICLHQ
jgi:hypothetical protein